MEISIIDIAELDEDNRRASSYLIMESLPAYYNVDGINKAEMATAITAILGESGRYLEKGFAALCENKVQGVLTYLLGDELPMARLSGSQTLYKKLSRESGMQFRNNLKHYDAGFGEIPESSVYISRFAVDRSYRGKNLASKMIEMFFNINLKNSDKWKQISLHVDKENLRAIAFYKKHDFTLYNSGPRYLTMVRSIEES